MTDSRLQVNTLVSSMLEGKERGNLPTLILGAGASISSDIPGWNRLCRDYCEKNGVMLPKEADSTDEFNKLVDTAGRFGKYLEFARTLAGRKPSLGYEHLANLVDQGFIRTIMTTNYDTLLEQALVNVIPVDRIKVLIRGEVDDSHICEYLRKDFDTGMVRVVKLHGDLPSDIFFTKDDETFCIKDAQLLEELKRLNSNDCIIVGHQMRDMDVLSTLLNPRVNIFYVNPNSPPQDSAMARAHSAGRAHLIGDECGTFDEFFTVLNMEAQRRYVESKSGERSGIETTILENQEKGAGYINRSTLVEMVEHFANQIKRFCPDLVVFVDDPAAPGGVNLKRLLAGHLPLPPEAVGTIEIEGKHDSRYQDRQVKSDRPFADSRDARKILILDAITFSGHTLHIAVDQMKMWYPDDTIKTGVLFIGEQLRQEIEGDPDHALRRIIYHKATGRYEVFFPWGVTQATGSCHRSFRGLETECPVEIAKRPWGTVEVLADEQRCSIRLLTIEADKELSFQRHLCRDEFFMPIDENICLELCGEDLETGIAFSDLQAVKSLILEKGDYVLIPKGMWHRFRASKERVRLLEIGYGLYDQVADIERRHDKYGRTGMTGEE